MSNHGIMSEEDEQRHDQRRAELFAHRTAALRRYRHDMRPIREAVGYNPEVSDEDVRMFHDNYRHSIEYRDAQKAYTGDPEAGYSDAEPWAGIYHRLLKEQRDRYDPNE